MDDTKDHLESSVNSEPEVISLLLAQSGQTVSLHDGTTAFIHTVTDKGGNSSPNSKFIDGQTVQLEDGTTAFIQATGKGLQAVQLEDGTTAYIHTSTEGLFDSDASTIGLEHFSVVPDADDHGSDKSELNRIQSIEIGGVSRISSAKALAMGDKAFRCSFEGCGRLYTTQHHLKVHERSHTGDRPFKCEVSHCNKAFATGYGLKSHTRVHTGEKPYKCPEDSCNKAFKTSGDLQKHVRTHTGERPFKCPYEGCDRSFTTSNIRKVHIRTHTGERPYICQEDGCGRAFASATNYKNHIRIHTGEKPYVCTIQGCGKRFTEYSSLYKHHVVHTHSKPYTCNLCGRNYRQTSTLAMHRRTSHGLLEQDDDPECILSEEDDDDCDVEPVKKGSRLHLTDATADTVANLVIQGPTGAPVMTTGEDIGTDEDTLSTLRLEHHKGHCSSRSYQAPQILVVTGTTPAQLLAVQSKTAAGFNSETTSLTAMVDGALITYSV